MKKKGFLTRNFSKILKVALVLVILFSIYQILKGLTEEKIMVRAIVSNECYSGSELNAIVSIYKTGKSGNTDLIGGKVVAKLKNGKDKVVRKTTETVRVKKGETGNISINVPEKLESGKYKLEIKGKSGIFSRKAYAELTVKDGGNQNIIINLDKGIYKPGDNVNYSGMILDGNSNEPIAEKDIQVNIYDGNDNKVYAQKAPSSKYGIVSGNFKLGDEINQIYNDDYSRDHKENNNYYRQERSQFGLYIVRRNKKNNNGCDVKQKKNRKPDNALFAFILVINHVFNIFFENLFAV